MDAAAVALVMAAHGAGEKIPELTREARLAAMPAASPVAQKIRALRALKLRRRSP